MINYTQMKRLLIIFTILLMSAKWSYASLSLSDLAYESATKKCLYFKEIGLIQNASEFVTCVQIVKNIELSRDPKYKEYAYECLELHRWNFGDFFDCLYAYAGGNGL